MASLQIVAAPGRIFKMWSMWLVIADGVLNLAGVAANALADEHIISAATFALANVALAFAIGVAKLVQQQIALTFDQKSDMIAAVVDAPVKSGSTDVAVTVNSTPAPPPV